MVLWQLLNTSETGPMMWDRQVCRETDKHACASGVGDVVKKVVLKGARTKISETLVCV